MAKKVMCWDNIEWLRAYVEFVQCDHYEVDHLATEHADKIVEGLDNG